MEIILFTTTSKALPALVRTRVPRLNDFRRIVPHRALANRVPLSAAQHLRLQEHVGQRGKVQAQHFMRGARRRRGTSTRRGRLGNAGIVRAPLQPKRGTVTQLFYRRIWPIVFLFFGILAVSGMHHVSLFGLHVNLHALMWFLMAAAHAHVFFPVKPLASEQRERG